MSRSALRAVSFALAAVFALQLGAALASASPCAVPCCPGMAQAADPDAAGQDAQPCRSLSPVSCCSGSNAAPAPEASAPTFAGPGPATPSALVPAIAPPAAPAHLARCAAAPPALRSTVLRL
jgi:hypothetical protein